MIEIKLTRLPHGEGMPLPKYASEHAAGLDVCAAEELVLAPGQRHAVATGFAIEIPHGYEVQVILANLGQEPFEIRRSERIAQLVPAPVLHADFVEVEALAETARGTGGFGSTGR